ncbi:mucin-17-like isoform X2 [Paramacrobiotus metropolitanus]|uniref:mucin-17-like isoform X2 n=1 Tax=Paramacrobiotus metropolitanus TaxID=2943436 RepID=UPI002445633D|nr:mucin-17-like isoform X2 [Paramacrobiotus metropolitanus]
MTTGLLVGCATALILVFAGNNDAAVMKGTLSWQIEVTAFFSYKSTADRDSMLQQILDVWKTKFDDKYQLYDEKITVVTELPGPEAFEQYKQLTFRISGKGPTGFNLKPLVSSFNTAITAAAIPGVELYLTSGSSTDGSTRFNVDVQANFVYSSSGARDRLLQQILALFKTQFASYSFTNLKIAVQSEQPSDVEGAKLLTFRISGQSSGDIDIKTLNTKFMAAIKTSKITGITLPESSGDTDEATTASTETDEGATSSNDTDEGTSATGGNKFTVTFNVVVKYNTQTELDAILQQILQIFKQKYGSLYGATQITIKVTGNKPNPSGGFSLTIVITGSSKTPINVTKVTKEFVTVVSSSKITGVQIVTGGSATGGGSGTSEEGGETEEGTTPKADTEEGTTLSSETEGGSTPKSETEEGTTPASGTEEGTTPASGTEEGTTPTSGSEDGTTPKSGTEEGTTPASGTEEGTMPNSGTEDGTTPQAGTEEGTTPKTDTDEATTPKNDSEEGTTPQSKPDDGTSDSGNTFTLEYTVILRFVTPVQRDRLLQQILQLWIKTYGGKYGVVNPQITATGSAKPSTSVTGSFVVTYTITGTSSTPVPDTVKVDFNKVLNNAKISGVVVDEDTTQGDNSVEGSTGDGSSGDQEVTNTGAAGRDLCSTVSVNQINGRTITRGTFSTNFTVYLTYKTASVRNDILQKLLAIWGDTLDQATKLKMCFYTEQLSIGKLEGGLVVNKVTYGISGMATVNFNTAAVAKVFEQAVADSSLQNVFFTTDFGDCSTKAVPDTNQFTITVSVIIKYKSQTELDTILQQILRLWIQKYGSIYGATRVTIKVTGKKPNPSGGFSLTIVISGSSRTVIDVTKVTKEFITVISKSKITGVTITTGGSVTGGGSATSEEGGETEEGTTPKSQAEEGTTPKSETEEGTTPKSETEEGTTPKSETNEGTTPSGNTDEGTTPKSHTGSTPQPDVDLDTTPKSGTEEGTTPNSGTEEGTTPKADTEERTTPQSKTEEGTTPSGETEEGTPSTGGNKFTVTVNVIVKYSTQTELDAILQQLLKIWIQKYGSLYGATHVTIKVTGKKPNPSGGFSLTIIITGSSKTVINVTKVTKGIRYGYFLFQNYRSADHHRR